MKTRSRPRCARRRKKADSTWNCSASVRPRLARHPRAHRAAISGHPPHQRNARAHRHDLLGAAKDSGTGFRLCGSETHRQDPVPRSPPPSITTSAGVPPRELDKLEPPMSGRGEMVLPRRHPGNFRPIIMTKARRLKTICFTLEGLSSFATSLNSYYLYFYMRDQFGFGIKENLAFAALQRAGLYHRRLAGRALRPTPRLFHRAQDRFRADDSGADRRGAVASRERRDCRHRRCSTSACVFCGRPSRRSSARAAMP